MSGYGTAVEPQVLTVSQLNQYLKNQFDSDPNLASVAVRGEISNYKKYPSGHHYFSLKDPTGVLSCVMFLSLIHIFELVFRAGCAAAVGSICALALRRYVPELALVLGVVTAGVVLVMMLGTFSQVQAGLEQLTGYAGLDEELTGPVYKVVVVAILSRLTSQVCRDAGEGTVALCCELAGTFAALCAIVPLLRRVLELIGRLIA